jgi:hypothetical protein
MSKRNYFLICLSLVFIFSLTFIVANWNTAVAEETRIIRLYGRAEHDLSKIIIEPQNLLINKGTVVLWMNWVKAGDVQIKFEDGKTCDDVTDAPSQFKMDIKGCYVTSWIKMGGTSSLQFNKKGTFKYTVERNDQGLKSTGTIVVRE